MPKITKLPNAEQCQSAKTGLKPTRQVLFASVEDIKRAMTELFEKEEWEIPDDAVAGKYAAKIATLEFQVKSLTARMLELQAKLEGKPGATARVDALAKKGQ